MTVVNTGATRHVFLVGNWAIKVPRITYGWRMFLWGLLGNMSEAMWKHGKYPGICPVLFAIPGGWLVIQRRARVMTEEEFKTFNAKKFCEREGYLIPSEPKCDSFGWLDGKIVAIDYGEIRV